MFIGVIAEEARVGHRREELVGTGPGNTDRFRRSDRLAQHLSRALMKRHFRTVSVDQQERVEGNHAP